MSAWPDSFDFETDDICQTRFKPFIAREMEELKAYDERRPENITYVFHEHAVRVAHDMKATCLHLGLGHIVAANMYWAILPHDIGKSRLPLSVWDSEEKPTAKVKLYRRTHTLIGAQIVQEIFHDIDHPFKQLMIDIMAYHHEQIDGNGTHGRTGEKLSEPVKLAAIVEAFDGWRIWRPHYKNDRRDTSVPGVLRRMRYDKGPRIFDMELFEAFAEMKMMDYNKEQEQNIASEGEH